jgi:hypothetical protein
MMMFHIPDDARILEALGTKEHAWKPIPTIEELNALSTELELLTSELNRARSEGFLSAAIAAKKP